MDLQQQLQSACVDAEEVAREMVEVAHGMGEVAHGMVEVARVTEEVERSQSEILAPVHGEGCLGLQLVGRSH